MTIYEQIQKAVEIVEDNLSEQLSASLVAREVFMSTRSFHNYFFAVTGFSYQDYCRKRRLTEASKEFDRSNSPILEIAMKYGYQGHSQFTRAFRNEFNISPFQFRKGRQQLNRTEKTYLYKELYMGVIVKKLAKLDAVSFTSYGDNCEDKAFSAMQKWLSENEKNLHAYRIFGHNVDENGQIGHEPQNVGYKVYLATSNTLLVEQSNYDPIEEGAFVVTGIEGSFKEDPEGEWIKTGWKRMSDMVAKKGYQVKSPGRWYEELLSPEVEGNQRFDLYLEIE